jgi:hypothetical protein
MEHPFRQFAFGVLLILGALFLVSTVVTLFERRADQSEQADHYAPTTDIRP